MTYYAHCMTIYGSEQEKRDIALISSLGMQVLDPSTNGSTEMQVYINLVRSCDMLAFRANPDGAISSGVMQEIETALLYDIPVFELPGNLLRRGLTFEQTAEYLRESGQR
jgi:hypothetical protein